MGTVQGLGAEIASADEVVVADDDAGDGGKEDRVGAEVNDEVVG